MNPILRFLLQRMLLLSAVLLLLGGRALAQAANDDCAQAVAVPITTGCLTPTNGTVAGATQSIAGIGCASATTTALDVWYSFVASGTSQDITLAPRFAAALEVRSGSCAASTPLFCATLPANNTAARPVAGLVSGQTYFIRIFPNLATPPTGVNATFALCVAPGATVPPTNDDCTGAIALPVTSTCNNPVSGTLALATQSLPPTANCTLSSTANDVWYSFVATGTSQNLTVTSSYNPYVEVRTGTCASSTSVVCGLVTAGQVLNLPGLVNGQAYFLRLYTGNLSGTTNPAFALCLTDGPPTPANDECATAQPLLVASVACVVPTGGSVAGATQSLAPTVGCSGGSSQVANDVWYRFVATGSSQIITATATFSAIVEVRAGTCASSTSVVCGAVGTQPLVPTGLTAGQTYFVRVYSYSTTLPSPTNLRFTLCITDGPGASINDECSTAVAVAVVTGCATSTNGTVANATQSLPASTCGAGTGAGVAADVWYSFVATGSTQLVTLNTPFLTVLEIRSGTCATSSPVFCTTVRALADAFVANGLTAGQPYFIRIYATGQTPIITNSSFTLCLSPAPTPPANDECAAAVLIPVTATCAAPVSGTLVAASQSLPVGGSGNSCGSGLAQDVWYRFVATATQHLVTLAAPTSLAVEVRSGTCASSTSLDCSFYGNPSFTKLITGLTVGQTYFLRVYGGNFTQPTAAANFTLCVTTPPTTGPANDECANAIALPINATCVPVPGTVAAATQSIPVSPNNRCGGPGTIADVWYSFVATSTGQDITVNSSSSTRFVVEALSGTCGNLTSLLCGDPFQPLQVTGLTVGQTYYIRIYAVPFLAPPTGSGATFTICLTGAPANDDPCGAVPLPLSAAGTPLQPLSSSTAGATSSSQPVVLPPNCSGSSGVRDVWFSFTPAAGVTSVRLAFTGTGASRLRLFTITNCTTGPLTQIGCYISTSSGAGGLGTIVLANLVPGQLYYLALSDNGPGSTTGPFTIAGASILTTRRAQADTEALVVYPNPSHTGQLTLRLGGPAVAGKATLLNALGQAVLHQAWPAGTAEPVLNTRALATGVYTLRVAVGEAVLTRKVLVE